MLPVRTTRVLADGTEVRTSPASARSLLLGAMAALSTGAAAIHFAVMFEHFGEYFLYGVFFLVLAWAQLVWPARAHRTALPHLGPGQSAARTIPGRLVQVWADAAGGPPGGRLAVAGHRRERQRPGDLLLLALYQAADRPGHQNCGGLGRP